MSQSNSKPINGFALIYAKESGNSRFMNIEFLSEEVKMTTPQKEEAQTQLSAQIPNDVSYCLSIVQFRYDGEQTPYRFKATEFNVIREMAEEPSVAVQMVRIN